MKVQTCVCIVYNQLALFAERFFFLNRVKACAKIGSDVIRFGLALLVVALWDHR